MSGRTFGRHMGAAYPAGAVVAVELDDGREFGVRIAGTGSAAQVAQLWSSAVGRFDHRHRDVRVAETLQNMYTI